MAYTVVNPKAHFDVETYQGSSSTKTISGVGFKPDMVWIKDRTAANNWGCYDSSRGVQKWLTLNENYSQNGVTDITATSTSLASFTSDGFTVSTMSAQPINNTNGNQFGTWMWKANGGTTTTNDASATSVGTIDSVYQANTTSGFSIVQYTGTGSAGTLAHGLGTSPKCIMVKRLNAAEGWQVYHGSTVVTSDPQTDYLEMNTNAGTADDANRWNDTAPTTAVFSIGTHAGVNTNGSTYVAYVFAQTQGFSHFGAYTGMTNNADGSMIYTGFKPSMVWIKRSDGAESWQVADIARSQIEANNDAGITGNLTEQKLKLDLNSAEQHNQGDMDIYSNGFKLKDTDGIHNWTNYKYVYMAFSQASIVGTNGRIALAY
jgi:hypothetical protein